MGLIWYATWTVLCNVAVLAGLHYDAVFPAALIVPTLTTAIAGQVLWRRIAADYAFEPVAWVPPQLGRAIVPAIMVAATAVMALFMLNHLDRGIVWPRRHIAQAPDFAAAGIVVVASMACAWLVAHATHGAGNRSGQPGIDGTVADAHDPTASWRVVALFLILLGIYYFGHRADQDDSNFVNLALGAQRSAGAIFQLDTMLGDGPTVLHLPTYKIHSFELLAASLSTLLHISPIAVLHLVLPLPEIILMVLVLWLVLTPLVGRHWLSAALLLLAFLFIDTRTFASWGLHGPIRFFQGKGFLVTVLVPLIAALTVRWFRRGSTIDLAALALAQICALGFSANGLYEGPLCSAFVAAAYVLGDLRNTGLWRRAILLLPSVAYPVMIAGVIALRHMALPSEMTTHDASVPALLSVMSGGIGIGLIALVLLSGLASAHTSARRTGLVYTPLALALALDPLTWPAVETMTGNLGFRLFWAMPWPLLIATSATVLLLRLGLRRERWLLLLSGTGLGAAILSNAIAAPEYRTHWHRPTLKIDRDQRLDAAFLAARTARTCRILAPEGVSQWLPTLADAPYPVFARAMYLVHYRFTMAPAERALRERLRLVVDGDGRMQPPSPAALAAAGIPIGTVAAYENTPGRRDAAVLAASLGLAGPYRHDHLFYWTGACRGDAR